MSAQEHHGEPVEQRSKIKVVRNAKGDAQWEVAVVAGDTLEELDRIREIAVSQHRALERALA